MGATPVGMECLPCLQDISVWLEDTGAETSKNEKDVRADLESAFKSALSVCLKSALSVRLCKCQQPKHRQDY